MVTYVPSVHTKQCICQDHKGSMESPVRSIPMVTCLQWILHGLGIEVQHSVPYVLKMVWLRPLSRGPNSFQDILMNCSLPISCWGHSVLHTAELILLRPTTYHGISPLKWVCGNILSIFHLHKFGCATYILISPPQRTSMGPYRKMGIYEGTNHRRLLSTWNLLLGIYS
jgi:hypothetical protein